MKRKNAGEFDLISSIRRQRQSLPTSILKSIGDDCAVIDASLLRRLVLTTDLLIENIHFRCEWTSPHLLGMKSALVNLSDLAAMGAEPYACLLSLGLPTADSEWFFEAFTAGFLKICQEAGMPLIGGDLSASRQICINVTAMGTLAERDPLYRSTACPGDCILIVGDLGYSRYGLEYLEQHPLKGMRLVENLETFDTVIHDPETRRAVRAHLVPEVHLKAAHWLQKEGLANSMIDVSDGLGNDLLHILEESAVSGQVDLEDLPTVKGLSPERQIDLALNGGEDYALLFTSTQRQVEQLKQRYPDHLPPWKKIGHISEGCPELTLNLRGACSVYSRKGYDHFQ